MKRLLIVYHSQFGGTRQIAEAAWHGARTIEMSIAR
jgi:flavodoxin